MKGTMTGEGSGESHAESYIHTHTHTLITREDDNKKRERPLILTFEEDAERYELDKASSS